MNIPENLSTSVSPPGNPQMEEAFFSVIKYGKFGVLTLLLILSFINGHKEYIAENPRKFMWDNFAVGATSAIGISIIAFLRGRPEQIKNLAFISFLLFFVYNVFREMSGFNAITDATKLTGGEAKQIKKMTLPIMIIVAISLVALLVLAGLARVPHPAGIGALAKEAAIFGLFTAIGEVIVAKNHGEHAGAIVATGTANFLMFGLGHVVLQYGGFYNHVFGGDILEHQE